MNLAEQIKELRKAQKAAVADEKVYVADVLLALRRYGDLKAGKWTDSELGVVLESLDELGKIVPKGQSKKLLQTIKNVDFNEPQQAVGKPDKKAESKTSSRRTGKGLGATEETDI